MFFALIVVFNFCLPYFYFLYPCRSYILTSLQFDEVSLYARDLGPKDTGWKNNNSRWTFSRHNQLSASLGQQGTEFHKAFLGNKERNFTMPVKRNQNDNVWKNEVVQKCQCMKPQIILLQVAETTVKTAQDKSYNWNLFQFPEINCFLFRAHDACRQVAALYGLESALKPEWSVEPEWKASQVVFQFYLCDWSCDLIIL